MMTSSSSLNVDFALMRSFSQFFANILVKGNNNKKPTTSVMNPGVIKTSPAMALSLIHI